MQSPHNRLETPHQDCNMGPSSEANLPPAMSESRQQDYKKKKLLLLLRSNMTCRGCQRGSHVVHALRMNESPAQMSARVQVETTVSADVASVWGLFKMCKATITDNVIQCQFASNHVLVALVEDPCTV